MKYSASVNIPWNFRAFNRTIVDVIYNIIKDFAERHKSNDTKLLYFGFEVKTLDDIRMSSDSYEEYNMNTDYFAKLDYVQIHYGLFVGERQSFPIYEIFITIASDGIFVSCYGERIDVQRDKLEISNAIKKIMTDFTSNDGTASYDYIIPAKEKSEKRIEESPIFRLPDVPIQVEAVISAMPTVATETSASERKYSSNENDKTVLSNKRVMILCALIGLAGMVAGAILTYLLK